MNAKVLRRSLLVGWLLVPTGLLAWHYGPGQARLSGEKVQHHVTLALEKETDDDWAAAVKEYENAIAALPSNETETRARLRLAHAKAQVRAGDLPEAMEAVEGLLLEVEKSGDKSIAKEVRGTQAAFRYYAAWLLRLEGATSDEWTEQVEQSRQHYRLLAERELAAGNVAAAEEYQKNLEAAVRLGRMDLSELKGKPLPKECANCNNVGQKCRSQKEGKCKGEGKKPSDVRQEISKEKSKGAGQNNRPEGSGS